MKPLANIADERARNWNHGRAEPGYNDGIQFTAAGGRFPANAWGLCDMHGNVAEWCRSVYKPYPHGGILSRRRLLGDIGQADLGPRLVGAGRSPDPVGPFEAGT